MTFKLRTESRRLRGYRCFSAGRRRNANVEVQSCRTNHPALLPLVSALCSRRASYGFLHLHPSSSPTCTAFWSWQSASRRRCCCQSRRSVMHLCASADRLRWSKLPLKVRTQLDMVRRRRLGGGTAVTTGVPAEVAAVQSAVRTAQR